MKIGINARFLTHPLTGIGQYTRNLIKAMAELELNNEYILFTPELVETSFPPNCKQVRIAEKKSKSASIRKANWEHVLLPKEMEKFDLDIAHFLYPSNPNHKLSIPTIVTVHDIIPWKIKEYRKTLKSKLYHFYTKLALRKANHIITVSDFSKKEIIKNLKIKEKNIEVIHLATPISEEEPLCPNFNLRKNYFLYVGGYDSRKNVINLMEAYQKHIAQFHKIDLILVNAKNKGLEKYISDKYNQTVADKYVVKSQGKIVLTNSLPQEELYCLYKKATALVHPSKYEGFNLALVEAMNAGIPIICSDIEVHHEVSDNNALFFNPDSIDSIGSAMNRFLKDKNLENRLINGSKKRIKDFTWKKTAEETLYVYNLFA